MLDKVILGIIETESSKVTVVGRSSAVIFTSARGIFGPDDARA